MIIADVEDAIIQKIKEAPLPYNLGTVESYGGQLAGDISLLAKQFPAIWIYFSGEPDPKPLSLNELKWIAQGRFTIIVATRSARGEKATRVGGPSSREVGAYQILEDLRNLLALQDLGLPINPLRPGKVTTLFSNKNYQNAQAIYTQDWSFKYIFENQPTLPELLRINLGYDLAPFDNQPDVSDLVELSV